VAIARQGGGSHTAFAGVLKRLLGAEELAGYEVVGLSGTSGGAVCALLAWSALLEGDPAAAGGLLEDFWADNSAATPLEQLVNAWVVWAARLENLVVLPAVSPYDTWTSLTGLEEFRRMLERRVDSGRLAGRPEGPMLLLGAVDVLSGEFRAFNSRREAITADMVLASAGRVGPAAAVAVAGDGLQAQPRPGGRAGLLRRRRRADLGAAVPRGGRAAGPRTGRAARRQRDRVPPRRLSRAAAQAGAPSASKRNTS
jgi:NTE family protein